LIENAISVFIQAGGDSSRMGVNKALLRIGDTTCLERVVFTARQISDDIAIVANAPSEYEQFGLPVYPDVCPGFGPLSGIHTALSYCRTDWALVLACDLPFITARLLDLLKTLVEGGDALVPLDKGGFLQPLCALYSPRCLTAAIELINSGHRAPRLLFDKVRTRVVSFAEITHLDGAERFFYDLDTLDDYHRALLLARDDSEIAT
jgi:molybdopterin-guanine dinucleotide biosynthesis protein A